MGERKGEGERRGGVAQNGWHFNEIERNPQTMSNGSCIEVMPTQVEWKPNGDQPPEGNPKF